MKVTVLGSTKVGYNLPVKEALAFGGKSAGICYMPDNFEALLDEPEEKTEKRIKQTLGSGHHSVYDHPTYNLLLEGIPKFLAMVLNNEKMYTTSEKSARYTKMQPTPKEMEIYTKWLEILKNEIQTRYDRIKDTQAEKLAQENARYMISVFTPTTMEYTVSLRQLNYIVAMMSKYIKDTPETNFSITVKAIFMDFISETHGLTVEGLDCLTKHRALSLFDKSRTVGDEFGETYCTTYYGTFAMLAQAQRHRTLDYKMFIDEKHLEFYTPLILRKENRGDNSLEEEWQKDISSLAGLFPQGTMVRIKERGTYENFMLKCMERLCGCAQLEIMKQTIITFDHYITSTGPDSGLFEEYTVTGYDNSPRCLFPGWKCSSPCIWGPKEAFTRLI